MTDIDKTKKQLVDELTALRARIVELETTDVMHKQAEAELAKAKEEYRDLYENSPDFQVSVDPATAKIIKCNKTLAEATGYAKEEIIGRPIFEMYHPESLEGAKEAFQSFVTTGEVNDAELTLAKKNGDKIEVSLNVSSVKDDEGNVLHSRSSWRDITERKQAEEALHKTTTFLNSIIDQSPFSIWISDSAGTMIRQNQACRDLLNITDEDVVGKYNLFQDNITEEQGFMTLVRSVF
ncbi:MAG: PAS domain S-box protein, partial [Candidatus Electryonea clarkiae]|nr:PAS domain S-box protein [Candidatus Electryonea clarkiae]